MPKFTRKYTSENNTELTKATQKFEFSIDEDLNFIGEFH